MKILCQLKIFHIAKAKSHGIAPNIIIFFSCLYRPHRILPVVYVIPYVGALRDTASRETEEGGVQVCQNFNHIPSQTVVAVLQKVAVCGAGQFLFRGAPYVIWHKGNHIDAHRSLKGKGELSQYGIIGH